MKSSDNLISNSGIELNPFHQERTYIRFKTLKFHNLIVIVDIIGLSVWVYLKAWEFNSQVLVQ